MWYFLGLAVFKVELLAAEVGSKFKKKIDGKAAFKKKDTATTLIQWRAKKSKLWPCLFFWTPLIFGDGGKISKSVDFEEQKLPLERSHAQKVPHFRNPQDVSFHMVVPWIWVPIPKTQVNCQKAKKRVFCHFLLSLCKKISNGRQSDNFDPRRSAYG